MLRRPEETDHTKLHSLLFSMSAIKPLPAVPESAGPSRERIVLEARRHFLSHGFRGVTMDDLAAELGMSKKTLYAHFPGKSALLQAVLEDKLRSADADFGEITSKFSTDFL